MKSIYPAGPSMVPDSLTEPSSAFKRHVVLALIALFLFVGIYTGLMVWFGLLSYSLFEITLAGSSNPILTIVAGVCLAFLCVFMVKSLFIFNKNKGEKPLALSPEEEPVLFDFIHRLADEAGAPRPHKIFLSNEVNASVFYDLSIFNLFFPSKKNLMIGLGLINVLSIGELKAVLAHEFGHFAQRSMLLGRYVYMAQQIAFRVVHKRDALDKVLAGISSIDLRVAWIGWILSILVWAMRSLIEVLFSAVAMAERALSREMEFQADLVAVSLTGSDALIHALHKLRAADAGFQSSLAIINRELAKEKAVYDQYALQHNYIEKTREILNDPTFGATPKRSAASKTDRVFSAGPVNPPQMWSTHPLDNDREENAKRTYIFAEIDENSSWTLFQNPKELRLKETAKLISTAEIKTELLTNEASLEAMNKSEFDLFFLKPEYQGAYLNRFPFLNFETLDAATQIEINDLPQAFSELYPSSIRTLVQQHQSVISEIQLLKVVQHEVLTAEKRNLQHRGEDIQRKDIPAILEDLRKEEATLRAQLMVHDRKARAAHLKAAQELNPKVAEYLVQLNALVHYAEHVSSNLDDAAGKFNNTLHVVLADGRVSSSELVTVMNVSNDLHRAIGRVFKDTEAVKVDASLVAKMEDKPYAEWFEKFVLEAANESNINSWVNVVGGWVEQAMAGVMLLRNCALERLLEVEQEVQGAYLQKQTLTTDTGMLAAPKDYPTLTPGKERSLQYKLDLWDRFHASDGILPTLAKFSVAAAIIFAATYVGNMSSSSELYIVNGLSRTVVVSFDGAEHQIAPHSHSSTTFKSGASVQVLATTLEGDTIEYFSAPDQGVKPAYVYNIAQAATLVESYVTYGYSNGRDPWLRGPSRWLGTDADYILEQAPSSINLSSHSSGATKRQLDAVSGVPPSHFIQYAGIDDLAELKATILSHAQWDDDTSTFLSDWMDYAGILNLDLGFAEKRLLTNPDNVAVWRVILDASSESRRKQACETIANKLQENSSNANWHYLNCRCVEDKAAQNTAFLEAYAQYPKNKWLAKAAGYSFAEQENWEAAYSALVEAVISSPSWLANHGQDIERIRGMVDPLDADSKGKRILAMDPMVGLLRDLKEGTYQAGMNRAIYLLSIGKFESILEEFPAAEADNAWVYWFLASSENAPQSVTETVKKFNVETEVNETSIWSAIAFQAKHDLPYNDYLQVLSDQGWDNDTAITTQFIELVKQQQYKEAEASLNSLNHFRVKANHYLIGRILAGKKTPEKWTRIVDRMLFVNEKPYFASSQTLKLNLPDELPPIQFERSKLDLNGALN